MHWPGSLITRMSASLGPVHVGVLGVHGRHLVQRVHDLQDHSTTAARSFTSTPPAPSTEGTIDASASRGSTTSRPPIRPLPPPARSLSRHLPQPTFRGRTGVQDQDNSRRLRNPEQTLLLRAAVLPAPQARAAWQALHPRRPRAAGPRMRCGCPAPVRRRCGATASTIHSATLALARSGGRAGAGRCSRAATNYRPRCADAGIDALMLKEAPSP